MNNEQVQVSKNILRGLNFLANEADGSGADRVARILKLCARDVHVVIKNSQDEPAESAILRDESLFHAIQFLTKFASLKDPKQKRDLLSELERLGLDNLQEGNNAI